MILYLCPGRAESTSGELRKMYDHVEMLQRAGFEADAIDVTASPVHTSISDVLVFPELAGDQLAQICPGVPRVSLNQNGHYMFNSVADWTKHPYTTTPSLRAVLCVSAHTEEMVRYAFPDLAVPVIRFHKSVVGRFGTEASMYCGGWPRRRLITLFAKKRPERVRWVLGLLAARGTPEDWEICTLDGLTDDEIASLIREATIYLSFGEAEGIGSSALEAMACGALVIGFGGYGASEYLTEETGIPIADDDVLGFARAIESALADLADPRAFEEKCRAASAYVLSSYDRAAKRRELAEIFERIAPLESHVVEPRIPRVDRAPRSRPSASIVILGWNAWEHTKACLVALYPTLGASDQVIVVDNGSTDGTGEGLLEFPWVEVVSNTENRGFAGGCNDGASKASREVVVFLNNDTIPSAGWLDGLLWPFEDPLVAAVGPRSNEVSGPQVVRPVGYRHPLDPQFSEFTSRWSDRWWGQFDEVRRLVGFCLAVRRAAFDDVEGFDERYETGGYEDDDLCRKLDAVGLKLMIAHESFVHHTSHVTFDANGLEWLPIEHQNRERFEEKWALT